MDTELSTYTDRELAQEFVDAYAAHIPCEDIEEEINRRGVSSEELSMILDSYMLLTNAGVARASREEFEDTLESVIRDIVAALREV